MTSFWHLTATCCIPIPNLDARLREQEIFRQVHLDSERNAIAISDGRWKERSRHLAIKDKPVPRVTSSPRSNVRSYGHK